MERAQFEAMVKRLEEYSVRQPENYRRRVGLLAALGYGYVLFVLAIVLLLIAALVWIAFVGHHLNAAIIKIGFFLLVFAFIIIRSLWVRFPPPEGVALSRDQVPKLFKMIDELTTRLQAPRFHHVLLTDDFNAAVMQVPRLGLLGWQVNYLLLGLPLMQALPPEQFRAVVAHELGHLSGNHGRFGGWIYRIYQTWEQILNSFAQSGHNGGWIFEKFLKWYAPFFGAYSFVLRRADEYVADRCAAELTSAPTAASALVNVEMKGRFLQERFWPPIYKSIAEKPEPPNTPFSAMSAALRAPFTSAATTSEQSTLAASRFVAPPVHSWLARAFREKTDYSDTHPSLTDRLSALGFNQKECRQDVTWLAALQASDEEANAASFYLSDKEAELTTHLDQAWYSGVAPQWKVQHDQMQEGRKQLQDLENKANVTDLTHEEAWERATLTGMLFSNEAALPLIREVLLQQPDFAPAHYALGEILIEQGDETGIASLEHAAELDSDAALPAYGLIYNFLLDQGREDEAAQYRERANGYQDEIEKAIEERSSVSARDEFLPPKLSPKERELLQTFLNGRGDVAEAYLACKKVQHLDDKPMQILALVRKKPSAFKFSQDDEQFMANFLSALQTWEEAPIGFVIVQNSQTKKLFKKIVVVEGARVYSSN